MLVPNRHGNVQDYRYGFNGKEKDDEVKGEGNWQDYGLRMYDPRIGRFPNMDPLSKDFPNFAPYQFAGNTPIAAIDLDGAEPKIVVTGEVTGITKIKVYGAGNVKEILVRTYKTLVSYKDKEGDVKTLGVFNVTRDGWYDMGTDKDGNAILYNRSSDAINTKKIYIQSQNSEQYGAGAPSFTMTPIDSPIPPEYNSSFFENGQQEDDLSPDVKREGGMAQGAQFHVGAYYEKISGEIDLAGAYGCYGIVDPSQISTKSQPTQQPSNKETVRFGKAIKEAQKEQVKEHGKKAKVEVEIKQRQYNKKKILSKS